jgi:hypothetical protein
MRVSVHWCVWSARPRVELFRTLWKGTLVADLELVNQLAAADQHLAVFNTARLDGTVHASVVNAGVIDDPIDGHPGVGAIVYGTSRKLSLLRQSGTASVVFKSGFDWVAVAGPVRLIGPDDGTDFGLDVPEVIRSVFRAAGGSHDDWAEFDRIMAAERRCAVFVGAAKVTTNPTR